MWVEETTMTRLPRKTAAELRRFGVVIAIPFALLGGVMMWKGNAAGPYLCLVAVLFLLSAILFPVRLSLVERTWMQLARILSTATTWILLTVVYYLVITPVGVLLRLFGKVVATSEKSEPQ